MTITSGRGKTVTYYGHLKNASADHYVPYFQTPKLRIYAIAASVKLTRRGHRQSRRRDKTVFFSQVRTKNATMFTVRKLLPQRYAVTGWSD